MDFHHVKTHSAEGGTHTSIWGSKPTKLKAVAANLQPECNVREKQPFSVVAAWMLVSKPHRHVRLTAHTHFYSAEKGAISRGYYVNMYLVDPSTAQL